MRRLSMGAAVAELDDETRLLGRGGLTRLVREIGFSDEEARAHLAGALARERKEKELLGQLLAAVERAGFALGEGDERDDFARGKLQDLAHRLNDGWYSPRRSWQSEGMENGVKIENTRRPVERVAELAQALLDELSRCEAVATIPVAEGRINVSDYFLDWWSELRPNLLHDFKAGLLDLSDNADWALTRGFRLQGDKGRSRPPLLAYDDFVVPLAWAYNVKTGRDPCAKSGTPRADFVRLVQEAEGLLPAALRANSFEAVKGRVKGALGPKGRRRETRLG